MKFRYRRHASLLVFGASALVAGCATAPEPSAPVESRTPGRGVPVPEVPTVPGPGSAPPAGAHAVPVAPAVQVVPAPVAPVVPLPSPVDAQQRDVRNLVQALLPPALVRDREGWTVDIVAAFSALRLVPSAENVCASIAVIEQESGFQADPVVPGLSRIVWKEIETRRQRYLIPKLALDAALAKPSPDGRSYRQRIDRLKTEREMSVLYGDIIDEVPGGRVLLSGYNPVRTGGPMQVSIAFAEVHARGKPYADAANGNLRDAVFSRRGGLHFGIAHLLDYPVAYRSPLYRFADYNAGHYASRNAAFQLAVGHLSGRTLVPDGDLLRYDNGRPSQTASATQAALRTLSRRLRLDEGEIDAALRQEKQESFARTMLYRRVFEFADASRGRPAARETLPRIRLKSPKITSKITTAWFADRVNMRYGSCMGRAAAVSAAATVRANGG